MKSVLTALTLAICAVGSSQAAPVQWTGAGANGHWYQYFDRALTATQAATAAQLAGGYLATITSANENAFVADLAGGGGAVAWLGGSDDGAAVNDWSWRFGPETGDAFTYTNWWGGEPNNCCGGENYVQINWGAAGRWNDHGGPGNAGYTFGYVVEYAVGIDPRAVPEPMTLAMVASGLLAAAVTRRRRA